MHLIDHGTAAGKTAAVSSAPLRRNIELKARCCGLAAARTAAERLGAQAAGELQQIDTYFHCEKGRLKLREMDGHPAELISYSRADEPRARASDYQIVAVPDPAALKSALTSALGVRIVVEKKRQLLLWHNVRIHLDEVVGLGTFLEFEAVIGAGDDEAISHERLHRLIEALGIEPCDLLRESYSDLIESSAHSLNAS